MSDFQIALSIIETTNAGMTLTFTGFGCSNPRVPVSFTVTASDAITIQAGQPALCLGDSTTLTASSTNRNYSYTCLPSIGLSSTTGAIVTANPTTITYTVTGDDGICANCIVGFGIAILLTVRANYFFGE